MGKKVTPYQGSSQSKKQQVEQMFDNISGNYDGLNRVISMGTDVSWRKKVVQMAKDHQPETVLDIATGTGDLAIQIAEAANAKKIVGLDLSEGMLKVGRKKIMSKNLQTKIEMIQGDSEALPFDDNSFDVTAIAFGIRNIPDKVKALSEMKRVIVDNGQVMILELTTPEPGFWRSTYSFYLNGVLPKLAKIFTKNPAAYEYLADSIMNFPTRKEFVKLMQSVGLKNCKGIPLTFGVCTLYIGQK